MSTSTNAYKTVKVTVESIAQDGENFEGYARFILNSKLVEGDELYIARKQLQDVEFTNGKAVANLVPNALLGSNTYYKVEIYQYEENVTSSLVLERTAQVPNYDCNLNDILSPEPSGLDVTIAHNELTDRDATGCHPISAITGLQDALDEIDPDQFVKTTDGRLTNARTPLAHTHTSSEITDLATTITSGTSSYITTTYPNGLVQSNDSRLSDSRTPLAHTHGSSDITDLNTAVFSGITSVLTTSYPNGLVQNNDARLSDSRTPLAHTHGSSEITDFNSSVDSRIATSYPNGLVQSNDARLSDARTPLAHTHGSSEITDFTTSVSGYITTTYPNGLVQSNDSRLTNARTPLAHTHDYEDIVDLNAGLYSYLLSVYPNGLVQSNDSRLSDARTPLAHTHNAADIVDLDSDYMNNLVEQTVETQLTDVINNKIDELVAEQNLVSQDDTITFECGSSANDI